MDHRRGEERRALDRARLKAMPAPKALDAVDPAMGRAPGREGLVAELGDAPMAAELGKSRFDPPIPLHHGKVAIGSLQHLMRAGEPRRREIDGEDAAARCK